MVRDMKITFNLTWYQYNNEYLFPMHEYQILKAKYLEIELSLFW